ncbi:cytochrome P450 [Trametopsis cervina]|nr:cytochrome P450 [Trametopsis cervina]
MLTLSAVLTVFLPLVLWRIQKHNNNLKLMGNVPGIRPLFAPMSLLGAILPTAWWNPGMGWCWEWRETNYLNHSRDIISMVPTLFGRPALYIATVAAMKAFLEDERRIAMEKPPELVASLTHWGDNVIAASGNAWKRYRRIVSPAFNANTYQLVARESSALYDEMVAAERWKNHIVIDDINKITMRFALIIICRCGFGHPMQWKGAEDGDAVMGFPEALSIVSDTAIARLVLPSWAYSLPIKSLRRLDLAWRTVESFLQDLVVQKKAEVNATGYDPDSQRGDIFTRLVEAHGERGKLSLSSSEVIGNTFSMMFAGHETTARTLSGTLGFLAVHQEEQEKAVTEIMSVIADRQELHLDDIPRMKHLLACFYETLRIFPAGVTLTRSMVDEHAIASTRPTQRSIPLRKENLVIIDMIGVHHDPETFPEPETFRPSRWYDVLDQDVSMFGLGPRACVGRKFAQTEALCFLALFLRDWKVEPVLEGCESPADYERRVMTKACSPSLGFGVGSVKLMLVKREQLSVVQAD